MQASIERLKEIDREYQLLSHISALLHWDQETYMPEAAVRERADQLALLQGRMHDRITSPEIGEGLAALGVSLDRPQDAQAPAGFSEVDGAFLRQLARLYRRNTRIPRRLVTELARQTAIGHQIWVKARRQSDFSIFSAQLSIILALVREVASSLGYEQHPYDPLLDEYEPWMKTAEVEEVFRGLRSGLSDLLEGISASAKKVDTQFLNREYALDKQRAFGLEVLKALGYEFERGRLDESAHPFSTTLGSSDVRITTRYNPRFFPTGIFGTIHECGHSLYELGVAEALRGSILADGTSLGLHESQSRMWENFIGRSRPFWRHFFPRLKELFPEHLSGVEAEGFYRAVNSVALTFIRVEADEVTYNLHIILRFELEKRLIEGNLDVADLPSAWNEQSRELLGIEAPDQAQGVLQDIHWSGGAFGYFPTYALGNLYAAQFFRAIRDDLPDWEQQVAQGRFQDILAWLREKIHRHGQVYSARDLCTRVTGESLNPRHLLDHLREKFGEIYEL